MKTKQTLGDMFNVAVEIGGQDLLEKMTTAIKWMLFIKLLNITELIYLIKKEVNIYTII